MAHGFGLMLAAELWPFVERFVAAGYAVYLFDGFGDSDGGPRQWVSLRRHLDDRAVSIRSISREAECSR
jgi:hypothetical protein